MKDQVKQLLKLNASANYLAIPTSYEFIDGKYRFTVDFKHVSTPTIETIEKNISIISELTKARHSKTQILVGDYLEMPDGSESRVTHCWGDSVQDGGGSGSFYLCNSGDGSYSGGLNGGKPREKIIDTGKTKKALFWIFSEGHASAHRGFYFNIDVKVWKVTSMLKTAYVKFEEHQYNYHTKVNGELTDESIKAYFIDEYFNVGSYPEEKMRKCIDCAVYYS